MYDKPKQVKLVFRLSILVLLMFGFGFALVPIYKVMCLKLGINGKIAENREAYNAGLVHEDKSRLVEVQFVATINGGMPWAFFPKTNKIKIHPGELAHFLFYAENKSDHTMKVQAIPSVTPGIAAKYIKKTECFCFTQQILNGHEAMNMPVVFHLDSDLPKNINTITLAYTLFDITNS